MLVFCAIPSLFEGGRKGGDDSNTVLCVPKKFHQAPPPPPPLSSSPHPTPLLEFGATQGSKLDAARNVIVNSTDAQR